MNDKKKKIIEVSMKLFAEKGYHATSIQEIANQSDVSKGAFYLYFSSKEDLTIQIFDYYTSLVMEKLGRIRAQDLNAKEKLAQQLNVFLELLSGHKEYIIMQFRDNFQLGKQMDELMLKLNNQGFEWTTTNLKEIYGPKIEPYLVDAAVLFDGMMQGYCKWLVLHDLKLDTKELSRFIVKRLDGMILDMLNSNDSPQVKVEQLQFQTSTTITSEKNLLDEIRNQLEELSVPVKQKEELEEALEVIESELAKDEPKKIIIQGMLTHLQTIPELKESCTKLAELLDI